jgi:hypothetical protein
MKKISTTEEANQYYNKINKLIDEYIDSWKIRPTKLGDHLRPGSYAFKTFLEKNGLSDIEGIEKVLKDVLEDRRSMELDGVMKFESFEINLDDKSLNLEDPSIEFEKILADFYNTSVGHIELQVGKNHLYKIKDFGEEKKVIILSKKDVEGIKKNLISDLRTNVLEEELSIKVNHEVETQIKIRKVISEEKLLVELKNIVNQELVTEYVESVFSDRIIPFLFKEEYLGYLIFEQE